MNIYKYLNQRRKAWRPVNNAISKRSMKNMSLKGNEHGRAIVPLDKVFNHPYSPSRKLNKNA